MLCAQTTSRGRVFILANIVLYRYGNIKTGHGKSMTRNIYKPYRSKFQKQKCRVSSVILIAATYNENQNNNPPATTKPTATVIITIASVIAPVVTSIITTEAISQNITHNIILLKIIR